MLITALESYDSEKPLLNAMKEAADVSILVVQAEMSHKMDQLSRQTTRHASPKASKDASFQEYSVMATSSESYTGWQGETLLSDPLVCLCSMIVLHVSVSKEADI